MTLTWESVNVVIDDSTIARNDPMEIIAPVWFSVSIYDGLLRYENDLKKFTNAQRYVFAVLWYDTEVNNGGHDQFYSNSTGIVCRDAADGFEEMGLWEAHENIVESMRRMGGDPPADRDERNELLDNLKPDFGDLDDRHYELDRARRLSDRLMDFIKSRPKEFYCSGVVERPVHN